MLSVTITRTVPDKLGFMVTITITIINILFFLTGGTIKYKFNVLCLVAQSCPTLSNPMDCSPPGSSVHGDSPGKNTGVGCHSLLQGIFPTQGSNPGLHTLQVVLYHPSYQGSPCYVSRPVILENCSLTSSKDYVLITMCALYPLSISAFRRELLGSIQTRSRKKTKGLKM